MALSRGRLEEIPKDAVQISEDEALSYQWKIISEWEKTSDVWSLRFAPGIIGGMAAATGIFVNNYYRTKVRLGDAGRMTTYLPIVVIPALFSVLAHKMFVQRSILLEPAQCPLCVQMRAGAVQMGLGVVYPTLLAPFAAFMFATRHFTYRLPPINERPLEVLQLWRKMTRPIVPKLGTIAVGQALIVAWLTFKEEEQNFRLNAHLQQLERRIAAEQRIAVEQEEAEMLRSKSYTFVV